MQAALRKEIELFTSAWLLDELADVMSRAKLAAKVQASDMTAAELVISYAQVAHLVIPVRLERPVVLADPDDDHVLSCALAAQADLVVSGDQHLLHLMRHQEIPIVKATDALRLIERARASRQPRKGLAFPRSAPAHVRRDRKPASMPFKPRIGVPAASRLAVGLRVGRARMDDGHVADALDMDVAALKASDARRPRNLREERRAVDERAVGIAVDEIGSEDFVEAPHIGVLHGPDVVAVELLQ